MNRLEVIGAPVPVVQGVMMTTTGAVQMAVANDGTLVYLPGGAGAGSLRQLTWVDRNGREEPLPAPPRAYAYPRISPDGTRIVLDVRDQDNDIWIWDTTRQTLARLTTDRALDQQPTWMPDGRRVIFASARVGIDTGPDLMTMRLPQRAGERHQPTALLRTPFAEPNADVSPDARWLAYESNQSGDYEIYVRPLADVNGGVWQVSTAGGRMALWSRDGRELFFVAPDGTMMGVQVGPGST